MEDSSEIGGLAGWVLDVVQALGAIGVGLLVLLENLVPPIPSEVILPLAGFLVGRGELNFWAVVLAATAGSVLGALLLYWIGRLLGRDRLRWLIERVPLVEVADLERAEHWFARYGYWAVLLGRMVPVIRSVISIPAGVERMPQGRFLIFTAIGSLAWNALFVGLGAIAGDRWRDVGRYSELLSYAVVAALVGAVGWFVVKRLLRRRARERDDDTRSLAG